jgi:hypothetical protein
MAYEMFLRNCGLERIPIVLLSGVDGLERVALGVGTPYFLGKPFSLAALYALVERALAEGVAPVRDAHG